MPWFKDPKVKISIWTIIKDSIGKDLTKIAVPVYFNEPLNFHQKCASQLEYIDLMDTAVDQTDPLRRLAFIAAYTISNVSNMERSFSKPFNPLLGETYEYVSPSK